MQYNLVLYLQAESIDSELHDDDDFTKTLAQLDELQSKKVRLACCI